MYATYEELIKEAYDSRYTHDDTEQWLGGAEAAKFFFEQYQMCIRDRSDTLFDLALFRRLRQSASV